MHTLHRAVVHSVWCCQSYVIFLCELSVISSFVSCIKYLHYVLPPDFRALSKPVQAQTLADLSYFLNDVDHRGWKHLTELNSRFFLPPQDESRVKVTVKEVQPIDHREYSRRLLSNIRRLARWTFSTSEIMPYLTEAAEWWLIHLIKWQPNKRLIFSCSRLSTGEQF